MSYNNKDLKESQAKECSEFYVSHERHHFDPAIACQFGVLAAIIYDHILYWTLINKRAKRNLHDNRIWTYQTIKQIAQNYSYLSTKQIETTLNKLIRGSILIKGNFNKTSFDRTCWYAIKEENPLTLEIGSDHLKRETLFPNRGNQSPQSGKPIPDRETYREANIKKEIYYKENPEELKPKQIKTALRAASPTALRTLDFFLVKINEYRKSLDLKELTPRSPRSWKKDCEYLVKHHKQEEVHEVIEFTFEDNFWKGTIQSPAGIRKHYEKLEVRMADRYRNHTKQVPSNKLQWTKEEKIKLDADKKRLYEMQGD